jgi:hypothetical protein
MCKKALLALLCVATLARPACDLVTLPLDWTSAAGISRANLNLNPIALRDAHNDCADTLNTLLAAITGYAGALALASNQDLILKVDADANGAHKLAVLANSLDSMLRIHEDGTARLFDHLVVDSNLTARKVSAADSVVGAHLKTVSGNLIVGGTAAITGATSTGALSSTTGSFSGTLGVTGAASLGSSLTFATGQDILIGDNSAAALTVSEGGNAYLRFTSSNGSESIQAFKAVTMSSTLGVTGAITSNASTSGTGSAFVASSSAPTVTWVQTAGGTNEKNWDIQANTASLDFRTRTDANASGTTWLSVSRSGTTPTTAAITANATTVSGTLGVSGAATMAGITSSGDVSVSKSAASNTSIVSAVQSDNTSGTSNARLQATAGGASGGDAFTRYTITGVTDWSAGADNSDGDAYVITPSTTPGGTTNGLRISTAGAVTIPGTLGVTGVTTATGGLTLGARFVDKTATVQFDETLGTSHSVIFADAVFASFTLTLPAASGNAGLTYAIYKVNSSANTVTIDGNGSESISGAASVALYSPSANARLIIMCDGANWQIKELYDEGTFTATLTGVSGSVTGTARYVLNGKMVTLKIPTLTGTSNTTGCTITGLPAPLNPANTHFASVQEIRENGGYYPGVLGVSSSGTITPWFRTGASGVLGTVFTASGTKGIETVTITYTLQ